MRRSGTVVAGFVRPLRPSPRASLDDDGDDDDDDDDDDVDMC